MTKIQDKIYVWFGWLGFFLCHRLNMTKNCRFYNMFCSLGSTELFSRADTTSGPGEASGTSCATAAVKNYTAFREERGSVQ